MTATTVDTMELLKGLHRKYRGEASVEEATKLGLPDKSYAGTNDVLDDLRSLKDLSLAFWIAKYETAAENGPHIPRRLVYDDLTQIALDLVSARH